MPILRVTRAHDVARAMVPQRGRMQPIRPIWGFWESKVPQNVWFPAQAADEPPCKIYAASFILGGEICNRTNKQKTDKQTKNNTNRYIDTLPIGMCG